MKLLLLFIIAFSVNSFGGTCSSISRTNANPNTILTSTKYNADLNTAYGFLNAFDGGCVNDNTVEKAALNTTDFAVPLSSIGEGCNLTKTGNASVTVDKCKISVNNRWISTTVSNPISYPCAGCSTVTGNTAYYVYAKTTSTGSTLDLLISSTANDNVGFDGSGNKVIGKFTTTASGVISTGTVMSWTKNGFLNKDDILINPGAGYTETFAAYMSSSPGLIGSACTSSPCGVAQVGNSISSITRTSTGIYQLNTVKTYTLLICTWTPGGSGLPTASFGNAACTNCNSVNLSAAFSVTAAVQDSWASIVCYGKFN